MSIPFSYGGVDGQSESWGVGARWAARHPPAWIGRVVCGVNLDMVAGRGSPFPPESYSLQAAPWGVERLWKIGRAVAPDLFQKWENGENVDLPGFDTE